MLINGIHLLPELSGAMVWPRQRLVALADPDLTGRAACDRLMALLRRHQPRLVVCLGGESGAGGSGRLAELIAATDWVWVTGQKPPPGGRTMPELELAGLVFRHNPDPAAPPGEIAGGLRPEATLAAAGGRRPCFVTDGRRLVLPAFAAAGGGLDVGDAAFRPLFKRGFQVLVAGPERFHTVPRQRVAAPPPPRQAGSFGARRMSLLRTGD